MSALELSFFDITPRGTYRKTPKHDLYQFMGITFNFVCMQQFCSNYYCTSGNVFSSESLSVFEQHSIISLSLSLSQCLNNTLLLL